MPYTDAVKRLDELRAQYQQPQDQNEYDDVVRAQAEREQTLLRTSLSQAVERNPDEYARARMLADRVGLPEAVVERNLPDVDRRVRLGDYERIVRDAPLLRAFLTDEQNASVAHDDISVLQRIEMWGRAAGSGVTGVLTTAPSALLQVGVEHILQPFTRGAAQIGLIPEDPLQPVTDYLGQLTQGGLELQRRVSGPRPEGLSATEAGLISGLESFGMNIVALGAGLITRNPAVALEIMATSAAGLKYAEAIEEGHDPTRALYAALGEGVVEYLTEKIPVGLLFKDLTVGAPFWRVLSRQMAAEIPQEQVATILQDFNDWMVLNPEKTVVEFARERPGAAYQTFIATLVGTGLQTGTIAGVERVAQRFSGADARAQRAQEEARRLMELLQLAAESKLRERAPDTFEEFVQRAAEEGEGVTEVYVDAQVFGDVLNQAGLTPEDVSPDIARQYAEAAPVGGDIAIPVGTFAAHLAPETFGQELLQHLRTSPEDMSAAEAEQFQQEAAAQFREEAERALEQQQENEEFQQGAEFVEQTLRDELARANRFTAEVNNAYAAMIRDFYVTLADRLGTTPQQLYERYPLHVTAQPVVDPLEQLPSEQFYIDTKHKNYGPTGVDEFTVRIRDDDHARLDVDVRDDEGVAQIYSAFLPEGLRGYGIGQQLIEQAYREASELGLRLISDRAVSVAQMRAYNALRRKGWTIERNPNAELIDGGWSAPLGEAVIERIEPPVSLQQEIIHGRPQATLAEDAPPAPPEGSIRFRHFGNVRTPQLDPAFMGTGMRGEERLRDPVRAISLYPDTGFTRESGVGPIEYVVDIPAGRLYDASADPLGLVDQAQVPTSYTMDPETGEMVPAATRFDMDTFERSVRDAGFLGYHTPEAEGNLRGQARIFEPIDVEGVEEHQAEALVAEAPGVFYQSPLNEVQGFATIKPHLTSQERAQLRRDTAARLVEMFRNLPRDVDFRDAALAGAAKRGWYANAVRTLRQIFGEVDAPRFAALMAALSPQNSVEQNLANTVQMWVNWVEAGRPTDAAEINAILDRSVPGKPLDAWRNNTVRALSADIATEIVLSGPKVDSFMRNLWGDMREVTNDTWMANFALIDQVVFAGSLRKTGPGKGPGYLAMNAKVRRVAKRLTKETGQEWTPAEVQETVWSWAKTAVELADAAGETRSVEELVRDGAISDERITSTPDFATMLAEDASVREILEAAGYGDAIRAIEVEFGGVTVGEGAGAEGVTPALLRSARRLDTLRQQRAAESRTQRRRAEPEAAPRPDVREPGTPLAGLPDSSPGPLAAIQELERQYVEANRESLGLTLPPHTRYVRVNPERAARFARAYDEAVNNPNDPEVQAAYRALIDETLAQYQEVKKLGLTIEFIQPGQPDPYPEGPRQVFEDVRNGHLWVYPTDEGFGGTIVNIGLDIPTGGQITVDQVLAEMEARGVQVLEHTVHQSDTEQTVVARIQEPMAEDVANELSAALQQEAIAQMTGTEGELYGPAAEGWRPFNPEFFLMPDGQRASDAAASPLLEPTNEYIGDHQLLANDVFRIVHDIFGHAKEGNGFGPVGEENAWHSHVRMYSPLAARAMTSETRGQNSWVNYGPYGEQNRSNQRETVYAEQKATLLPEWVMTEGIEEGSDPAPTELAVADEEVTFEQAPITESEAFKRWFGDSKVVDENGEPLVVYHGTDVEFDSFADRPTWFSPNQDSLATRAFDSVIPAYIRLENPLVTDNFGLVENLDNQWREALERRGYDGVIYADPSNFTRPHPDAQFRGRRLPDGDRRREPQIVAFRPEQIKSAIGNRGTFDPSSPSILDQAPAADDLFVSRGANGFSVTSADKKTFISVSRRPNGVFRIEFAGVPPEKRGQGLGQRLVIEAYKEASRQGLPLVSDTAVSHEQLRVYEALRRKGWDIRYSDSEAVELALKGGESLELDEPVVSRIEPPDNFDQEARGQISSLVSQGGGATIALLRTADLSTFLHESGHFFLEVYADLASRPDTPQQIRDDFDALLKWFGVADAETWQSMSLEEKRPHHEKFARGFEAYLFEGKAPTSELQSLFQRFRAWLLNVYRSLTALNVELTDEVRGVMGRMLASDQAILETEQARKFEPLFESAEEAGMTQDEWERYQETFHNAREDAVDELQSRSLRDMQWASRARSRVLKQLQKEVAAKRRAIRAEVAEEVAREPIYRAMRWLSRGEMTTPQGEEIKAEVGYKLDIKALEEMYPPGELAEHPDWQKLRPRFASSTGTQHPDTIAELFGFRSGDHLVRALLEAEPMNDVIEAVTDKRMLEQHGDITDPAALEKAADEAVHNDARARFVATEIRALARSVRGTGVRGGFNVMMKAAREFARQTIARRKIRHLSPAQFAAAQTKAARAADRALERGDRLQAAAEKRNQLVNLLAVRAAYDAQNEIERGLRYLKKFEREGTRKNLDPEYLEQIDAILERFDLRRSVSARDAQRRQTLIEWVEAQREAGFDPEIPPEILAEARRTPYRELTVEEFRGLLDSVKQIEHLARLKHKLLTAKDKREFAAAVEEAVASIEEHARKEIPEQLEPPRHFGANLIKGGKEFFAMHRKLESLLREMDGFKDGGIMWELFMRPLNEAANREAEMRADATRELGLIFDEILDRRKLHHKVDIPAIGRSLSWEAIYSIALNWGNETNRKRVMEGDKWTPEQVQAILSRLKKEDWDSVQKIWDYVDSFWPEISAKQQRVYGIAPEKVEAAPVETPHGTYKGGYYPIAYDPVRSAKAESDTLAESLKQAMQGAYTRATTRRGHTQQRVESVQRPMRKDLGVLFQHVNNVIHDLTHHEALIDTSRLLRAPAIDQAIRRHYGPDYITMMRRTLEDVARGDQPAQDAFERGLRYIRTGATIAGLGWSLYTGLLQPLGITQSMVRVGPGWVAKGLSRWLGSPQHMSEVMEWIHEKSTFMRTRAQTMQREIADIQNQVRGKSGSISRIQSSYFYLIQTIQIVADVPTWLGQYEKSMAEFGDEAKAIALADQAVVSSQAGGQIKDLAAVERGGPMLKLWTNFYSFFNTTFNMLAESVKQTDWKSPKDIGRLGVDFLLLTTLPAFLSVLLREAFGRGDPDEELWKKLRKAQVSYLMGTMIGLRDFGSVVEGFPYRGPTGLRALEEIATILMAAQQGDLELDIKTFRRLNAAGGVLFHYPSGQVQRTVEGLLALLEGETENPMALISGPPRGD